MKKITGIITIALLAMAWMCQAVDYSSHFYDQRVYRVALGSGTAPSAADMATVRLHNGDQVLNTDDGVLYIMHATNVYTKFTAAGLVTATSLGNIPIASISNALTTVNKTDTNVNPVVTTHTPTFIGQILVGTVSSLVWTASGLTTNSWIVIK